MIEEEDLNDDCLFVPGVELDPLTPWGDKHSDQRKIALRSGMRVDWDKNERDFITAWLNKTKNMKGKVNCSECYAFVLTSAKARSIFHSHHVLSQQKFAYMYQIVARGE